MKHLRHAACAGSGLLMLLFGVMAWASTTHNIDRLYQEGVRARLDGRPAEAIVFFSQALVLQQGLALSASGRDNEAEPVLQRVLQLAPNYTDAQQALERIQARRRQVPEKVLPDSMEPRYRLDLGVTRSHLSGDRPYWKEGGFRLSYKANEETTISGGMDISRRYNKTDTYGELRVDHRFADRLTGYLYVGGTPSADFLPKAAVGLGGEYRLNNSAGPNATYALLNLRFSRYNTGNTWSAYAGIRQYLGDDHVWITVNSINARDEKQRFQSGFSLRMDWQAKPDLRLLAGFANAPESSDGLTLRTRTFFMGGVYDVSPVFALNLNLAHEKLSGIYDRNSVRVGLTYRF